MLSAAKHLRLPFVMSEFCMGLRPTYKNENRGEQLIFDGVGGDPPREIPF
jgi:hypothetical protein